MPVVVWHTQWCECISQEARLVIAGPAYSAMEAQIPAACYAVLFAYVGWAQHAPAWQHLQ